MKKTLLSLTITSALMLINIEVTHAQYTGPSRNQITTVADILENGKHNTYVQLTGKIIEEIEEGEYLFSDGTGEIRVEIDSETFTFPVDENTQVDIRGEFENLPMLKPEIDVSSIKLSK